MLASQVIVPRLFNSVNCFSTSLKVPSTVNVAVDHGCFHYQVSDPDGMKYIPCPKSF
jgi:hypothetical protein